MKDLDSKNFVCVLSMLDFSDLERDTGKVAKDNTEIIKDLLDQQFMDTKAVSRELREREDKYDDPIFNFKITKLMDSLFLVNGNSLVVISKDDQLEQYADKVKALNTTNKRFSIFLKRIANFLCCVAYYSLCNKGPFALRPEGIISPVLYRGGIDISERSANSHTGRMVIDNLSIQELNKYKNVYVEAKHLEETVLGPRLFMSEAVANILWKGLPDRERCTIQTVHDAYGKNDKVYEFIWTYYACEMSGCTIINESESPNQIKKYVEKNVSLLEANLLKPTQVYLNMLKEKTQDSKILRHYEVFINLINEGKTLYEESYLGCQGRNA